MTVPPPYGPPPVGYPPPGYPPPPGRPTNALAIASLVCAFLIAPLGVVFGHLSLWQIKRTGEEGRGMAIAGLIIGYVVTVLGTLALVVGIVLTRLVLEDFRNGLDRYESDPGRTAAPAAGTPLPSFKPPVNLGANCQYLPTTEKAARPVAPPRMGKVPTVPATVAGVIATDRGAIPVELDNAKAPCTVNNFASLAAQGFFNGTPCHRLTTGGELGVLQCGDPTGTGKGGPGYQFPNEYPTNQYRLTDPATKTPVIYPRGTLAMANSGPGTNGSQFFLVYRDSQLPPTYTAFGTIDETGLTVLDQIAAGGVTGGGDDGKPADPVNISTVRVR
ncbi:peptidyl-prolyl cis-trans isomerase (rotamase) - cyclophilin family [Mycolicibacterium canariasense]|uniref:Peptidyl-prolyl cis-trans isomerase (Rotamase)-cyclophilin family n=1 Tax=Mycolicibacterium canariasense TaxID=228230 RepID=A0A100WH75_MYCCR|nr:peptidylprolyl isomerase [Mycolicibacterium canariasense]MCV7213561.1 peptidylprolyl isomerase [Mycolicibacterium canariasense]ORV09081.1 cyclophilin [Mycolicibacterium canariasense]GAS98474.1 peptidyl-prolyl cis-trans isomerase (rotamase) - cyclophilin family [Mycolicibacterium canariasense]